MTIPIPPIVPLFPNLEESRVIRAALAEYLGILPVDIADLEKTDDRKDIARELIAKIGREIRRYER